jgi:hypothetical protein
MTGEFECRTRQLTDSITLRQVTNYTGIEWMQRHLGDEYRIHILNFEVLVFVPAFEPGEVVLLTMINSKRLAECSPGQRFLGQKPFNQDWLVTARPHEIGLFVARTQC